MNAKVFITEVEEITLDKFFKSITYCFTQFGGVYTLVKGNMFIKINVMMINPNTIITLEVIFSISY